MSLPVYLNDSTHESDIHEAGVFYYYYFVVQFYIYVTCGMIIWAFIDSSINQGDIKAFTFWDAVWINIFCPAIIPCIFSSILSLIIIVKKKITRFNILFTAFLAMAIISTTGGGMGLFLSILVPTFLMMHGDNRVYKYDKILKLQHAEHDRKIEAQLEKEQIIKKIHKSKDRSENLIHIELTRDEYDEKNKFRLFD